MNEQKHKPSSPIYAAQKQRQFELPKWDDFKIENISDNEADKELEWDSDVSIDDIKDDGKHPVWPLIIPNNCSYDARTGIMSVDLNKPRRKLILVLLKG